MIKKKIPHFFLALAFISATNGTTTLTGFKENSARDQQQLETRYDALLQTQSVDAMIKKLSARPHHLGSAYDADNAKFLLQQYREWGYEARIDTFYALFATPKTRALEGTGGLKFKAALQEPALKEDATTNQTSEQLPGYNCYSADGDVTGELVYVNQGVPADYEELDELGISVKGKIVIARYGGSWRGIKPRLAQEHGAIGCIIYSDPKDDGYYQGDVYPKGPFRNENGVQRGSVMDIPLYPGDPLTPGYAHTKNAKQLDRKDVTNLLKIPVLPISYQDAKPFLAALNGPVAPARWRGALPFTYHIGPGPVNAHLKLEFNWEVKPVYDVIAVLKGSKYPDQWVIRGNHYDAWVNGADDPISGQAAMLEEAKAIGELAKQGVKPKRTIIYCSWDGEEEGLLGSTEWAEANAAELQQKTVAYINTDATGRGFLFVGGSHPLEPFVNEVAGDVTDPETGVSILQRHREKRIVDAGNAEEKKKLMARSDMKIEALGSGSDFSPFLQHLGINAIDVAFGGESDGGEYHSVYDSYDMFKRFKDPGFVYEVVLAKTAGRLTMRLANADVLPVNFHSFFTTVLSYTEEITKELDKMRTSTDVENTLIKDKYLQHVHDPAKTYNAPAAKEAVPHLDFSPLENALQALGKSSDEYQKLAKTATRLPDADIEKLNVLTYQAERKLLSDEGVPQRTWYKHAIYAPGYYTGYGVKTLPGIREAIENRKWDLAQQQIKITANVLIEYTKQIDAANRLMSPK